MKRIYLQRPYTDQNELKALQAVLDSRWLGMGVVTKAFEDKICEILGVKHVISVNTGTSALHLALAALNLSSDEEVIVPSLTFVASLQAILSAGARPVFCDVREKTLNMNVKDVLERITEKTRVIMPVHYGGLACDMDELTSVTRNKNIHIVEDAAHAFGSAYKGRPVGTLGDITCFSFDPIKNITCGEGGAIVTDHDDIAERLIPIRNVGIEKDSWSRYSHKREWFYNVNVPGFRYHLSNLNAAIGLEQLKRLEAFKARKQWIVRRYDEAFKDIIGLKTITHNEETFPFLYTIRVMDNQRNALMAYLKERNIGTGLHYIPNHLQPLFSEFRVQLPVTERLYGEIMTLPLFFEMTDDELEKVIEAVSAFFKVNSR